MKMKPRQTQTQKLGLSLVRQQSLQVLTLPTPELYSMIEQKAVLNPVLDMSEPSGEIISISSQNFESDTLESIPIRSGFGWGDSDRSFDYPSNPQTYTEHLLSQLGQMANLDADTYAICVYIVGCLNSSGFLDVPLSELKDELSVSNFQLEQALFIVQQLDPPGSGARNLSECLLLQLVESSNFNELTVHMVQYGLDLLSKKAYPELAKLLGYSIREVQRASEIICSLNPIPSRGFYSGSFPEYIIPEAVISTRGDEISISISISDNAVPKVSMDSFYCTLAESDDYPDAKAFLSQNLADAKSLISDLDYRRKTLSSIITYITTAQKDYFMGKAELKPMTIRSLAEAFGVSTSTISRAVKDKYIVFNGKPVPIRNFFSASVQSNDGEVISMAALLRHIQRIISEEDPSHPLTDGELAQKLLDCGIKLSRRTVACKREALNIPSASKRKKK